MSGLTDNYRLLTLNAGDSLNINGYQFTRADRNTIDRLLYIGAEGHRHNGVAGASSNPAAPPTLALNTTGGNIPAGTFVAYKYTLVDDTGAESAASPEITVTTAAAIGSPGAPSLARYLTGGTLIGGNYYYILSAYSGVQTSETRPGDQAFITLSSSSSTWRIEVTLPSLPVGADGFNVFRRSPGESKYSFMQTIDMQVATPPTVFVDNGSININCNRQPPVRNSTNATNSISIGFPGATPTVPAGFTWKLYRSYASGAYNNSLLSWIVEETFESSGIITPVYLDEGGSTTFGSPPSQSQFVGSPPKIQLGNVSEVEGFLPVGRNVVPAVATFTFPGLLDAPVVGSFAWTCEYQHAQIVGCRATLGRDSAPSSQNVIIDVNKFDAGAASPSFSTIYTTQANRPSILVGEQQGVRSVPNVTSLVAGNMLTVDIDQVGLGATPNDYDLVVTIYLLVRENAGLDVSPTGVLGIA